MSFNEVIAEVPRLTFEQRQALLRQLLEIDDLPLSQDEEELVVSRLNEHQANPNSSIPLDQFRQRLDSRSKS
jgi:hypothetical protein